MIINISLSLPLSLTLTIIKPYPPHHHGVKHQQQRPECSQTPNILLNRPFFCVLNESWLIMLG